MLPGMESIGTLECNRCLQYLSFLLTLPMEQIRNMKGRIEPKGDCSRRKDNCSGLDVKGNKKKITNKIIPGSGKLITNDRCSAYSGRNFRGAAISRRNAKKTDQALDSAANGTARWPSTTTTGEIYEPEKKMEEAIMP